MKSIQRYGLRYGRSLRCFCGLLLVMSAVWCSAVLAQAQPLPAHLVGQLSVEEWQEIQRQIRSHARRVASASAAERSRVIRLNPIELNPDATTLNQTDYIKASNTDAGDSFGFSVAASGNRMVIGARFEASDGLGEDGNPTSNALTDAGAAYVYVRENGVWRYQAYLKASNPDAGDNFGRAVGISGDTIVVGAYFEDSSSAGVNTTPNNSASAAGAAYVYVSEGEHWTQQAYLKASNPGANDQFGESVAISADTIVIGARFEDSTTSGVNSLPNNSASNSGAVYVFVRDAGVWSQQAYIKASNPDASDFFGFAVDIDGEILVAGALGEGSSSTVVNGGQGNNASGGARCCLCF